MTKKIILFTFLLPLFLTSVALAQINLKVSAKNPSDISVREVEAKAYLPKNITPQNVLDKGDLEIGYDVKRGQYFVYKRVVLKEQEYVSYNVQINDIWTLDEDRIDKLKKHTDSLAGKLKYTEYEEAALLLQRDIDSGLDDILESQRQNKVPSVSVAQHIGVYIKNVNLLDKIKELIGVLEKLLVIVGQELKDQMGTPGIAAARVQSKASQDTTVDKVKTVAQAQEDNCISEEELRDESGNGVFGENHRIKLYFDIENPSDELTNFPVKYYLPDEVKAEDVLDTGKLKLSYDFSEEKYYVYSEAFTLEPKEKMTFEVTVRDKWMIDKQDLLTEKLHLEKILIKLKRTMGFDDETTLAEKALSNIYILYNRVGEDELTRDYITQYYADQGLFDDIRRDILKIEDRLQKNGINIDVTVVNDEVLCEEKRATKDKKTIAEKLIKKRKASEILKNILFQGKAPDIVTVWRIILLIIVSLGGMSFIFFIVWSAQSNKKKKYQKINPTFKSDQEDEEK